MSIKLALVGNPNCGKTTMFNAMTGTNQRVGNWPGVTVEKKEGKLKGYPDVTITDLPGIYSLSPYTLEEVVSRNYLLNETPNAIINLIDATNIERNLYLTTQVMELGMPVVVALNMMDVVEKNGDKIDAAKLASELGCPVIEVSALKGTGLKELYAAATQAANAGKAPVCKHKFTAEAEDAITQIEAMLPSTIAQNRRRWYAVKLFERDEKVIESLKDSFDASKSESIVAQCEDKLDDDSESIITNGRYEYITGIISGVYKKTKTGLSTSDKIDQIVTNRILALPIFVAVMYFVYYISIGTIGDWATGWTNDVLFGEIVPGAVEGLLVSLGVGEVMSGLILDGIIGGVGAVLGFVPQMLVLFFLLSILEDIGYMARIAFIMDRVFRRFGLSGKSFIPMLIGTGCGVPGIMASRTIENESDRRMTIMTTGFIPCGAKMPIVGLFAGALFGGSGVIAVSAYFIGVAAVLVSGIILKKTKMFAGEPAPFVMELPAYHMPTIFNVLRATWERGWSFIKRAGTVILLASIIIWFLSGFGKTDEGFGQVEDMNDSILADVGNVMVPVFQPIGFGNNEESWKASVATVLGLVAKEEVVGVMGVLYSDFDGGLDALEVDEEGLAELEGEELEEAEELLAGRNAMYAAMASLFTPLAAFSFMIFNLLCAPCFAAMGAIKREMNSAKWTFAAIGWMCGLAYGVALIVYQLGGLITGEVSFGIGTICAAVALVAMVWAMVRKGYQPDTKAKSVSSVKASA